MRLSIILFIATQMALVLSQKTAGPEDSDRPDTTPATELAPGNELFKRECWYGANYGCSPREGGFSTCWMKCGTAGEWCWMATANGSGDWLLCGRDSDCNPANLNRVGCSRGTCKACGCSC